jgi:hypothetical protein
MRRNGIVILFVSIIGMAVIACGQQSVAINITPTATQIPPSPTATSTPVPPTPIPAPSATLVKACFGSSAKPSQVAQSGDILVIQTTLGFLTYPSAKLPDGTSTAKPYRVHSLDGSANATDFPGSPITNPDITDEHSGSLGFSVCNGSPSKTHKVTSIWLQIASMTPFNAPLNEWQFCNGAMDSHHNLQGGGCGGAKAGCECFHVALPGVPATNTPYSSKQTGNDLNSPGDGAGTLPLTLGPGKSASFDVGIDKPAHAATFTFQLGAKIDGSANAVFGPPSAAILLSPVADDWGAMNCQKPAMLAQITPTTPESLYICP